MFPEYFKFRFSIPLTRDTVGWPCLVVAFNCQNGQLAHTSAKPFAASPNYRGLVSTYRVLSMKAPLLTDCMCSHRARVPRQLDQPEYRNMPRLTSHFSRPRANNLEQKHRSQWIETKKREVPSDVFGNFSPAISEGKKTRRVPGYLAQSTLMSFRC